MNLVILRSDKGMRQSNKSRKETRVVSPIRNTKINGIVLAKYEREGLNHLLANRGAAISLEFVGQQSCSTARSGSGNMKRDPVAT